MADAARVRSGVLLINLGTPDAPTPAAIRRYLAEFLWDRRVVDLPRALWWPILHGFILPFRPRVLAPQYGRIWRADGSPLRSIMRELRHAVETALLREFYEPVAVLKAMRYGTPDIGRVLDKFEQSAIEKVAVLPLYPQYSTTTTASALDIVEDWQRRSARRTELRVVRSYHDDPGYLAALADSVRSHWADAGQGELLLMSFHGIPRRYADRGDPYEQQCQETARRLAEALHLAPERWRLCYQSRIGRARWLEPYTDEVLSAVARSGVRRVDVICPGFATDCLETLDEIAIRYRDLFVAAGGEALRYVPALNARPAHAEALARIAAAQLTA